MIEELRIEDEMKNIKHPTLFIWGDKDVHGAPSIGIDMASHMENAAVKIIKDAGHVPCLDAPQETSDVIIEFFK